MRTAEDLLNELNAVDESTAVEGKKSSEAGKSALETICAFANEPGLGGGHLLLGVRWQLNGDGDRVYHPEGVPNPDKLQSDLASQCASVFNHPLRPEIRVEVVEGKPLVVLFMPEMDHRSKPVFIKSAGLPKGAYRRIGSTDQRCNEEDLWELRGDESPQASYDGTVFHGARYDDLDPAAIAEYRRLREKVSPQAEELGYNNEDLLEALGALQKDGAECLPTLAGVVLFGKPMALRRLLPAIRVDYLRIVGTQWIEDPDERFQTVEIRKPLLLALPSVEAAILDDLPKSFQLPEGKLQSEQEPVMPRKVIREALANALMHRSYKIHEPIQVIRYSDRIEIRNPGHSLKPVEDMGRPGSRQRSPVIAAVMHDLNLAETKGSGVRTMRKLCEQAGIPLPKFQSDRVTDTFELSLQLHHLIQEKDYAWLETLGPDAQLTGSGTVLLAARNTGAVDNGLCRSLTGLDTLQASGLLRRLRAGGWLAKCAGGKRTYYEPTTKLLSIHKNEPHQEVHQVVLGGGVFNPIEKQGDNKYPHQLPGYNPTTYTSPLHPSVEDLKKTFSEDLLGRLPKEGQRPRKQDLRQLIVDLCTITPLSARDLGELLGKRDLKGLVNTHLTPMLKGKILAYTIVDMPNHPDQHYTKGPKSP